MANWVTVENGEITGYYDLIPQNWRNISGLDKSKNDLDFLRSLGWLPVVRQSVDYDPATHDTPRFEYQIEENQVLEIPVVEPIPHVFVVPQYNPTWEELKANFMSQLRAERNRRLADCDYTQLADIQSTMDDDTKAKWAVYRQALRDFPAKYSDNDILSVENCIWPEV